MWNSVTIQLGNKKRAEIGFRLSSFGGGCVMWTRSHNANFFFFPRVGELPRGNVGSGRRQKHLVFVQKVLCTQVPRCMLRGKERYTSSERGFIRSRRKALSLIAGSQTLCNQGGRGLLSNCKHALKCWRRATYTSTFRALFTLTMWEKHRLQMDRPGFARQLCCTGLKSDFRWNTCWKAPKWVVLRPVGVWNNRWLCFMEREAAVVQLWQKLERRHDCKQAFFSEIGYISSSKDEQRLAVKAADWLWQGFVTCRGLVTGVRSRPFYRPKSDRPICDSDRHLSRFILTGPSLSHFPPAALSWTDVGNKSHRYFWSISSDGSLRLRLSRINREKQPPVQLRVGCLRGDRSVLGQWRHTERLHDIKPN